MVLMLAAHVYPSSFGITFQGTLAYTKEEAIVINYSQYVSKTCQDLKLILSLICIIHITLYLLNCIVKVYHITQNSTYSENGSVFWPTGSVCGLHINVKSDMLYMDQTLMVCLILPKFCQFLLHCR